MSDASAPVPQVIVTSDPMTVQGPKGDPGSNGVSVSSVTVAPDGHLHVTLSDDSVHDAGMVKGVAGKDGKDGVGTKGDNGRSVSSVTVNPNGDMIVTYSDNTTTNAGNTKGPKGDVGRGISGVSVNGSGNLILTFSDTTTVDVGVVRGATGPAGPSNIRTASIPTGALTLNIATQKTLTFAALPSTAYEVVIPAQDGIALNSIGVQVVSRTTTQCVVSLTALVLGVNTTVRFLIVHS